MSFDNLSSQTMHHGAAIFSKRRAGLPKQYRTLANVWRQSANITFLKDNIHMRQLVSQSQVSSRLSPDLLLSTSGSQPFLACGPFKKNIRWTNLLCSHGMIN